MGRDLRPLALSAVISCTVAVLPCSPPPNTKVRPPIVAPAASCVGTARRPTRVVLPVEGLRRRTAAVEVPRGEPAGDEQVRAVREDDLAGQPGRELVGGRGHLQAERAAAGGRDGPGWAGRGACRRDRVSRPGPGGVRGVARPAGRAGRDQQDQARSPPRQPSGRPAAVRTAEGASGQPAGPGHRSADPCAARHPPPARTRRACPACLPRGPACRTSRCSLSAWLRRPGVLDHTVPPASLAPPSGRGGPEPETR